MSPLCPVCGAAPAAVLAVRSHVPVFLNRLAPTRAEALAAPAGRVEFVACERCGFVWNRAFEPGLLAFDPSYNAGQDASPAFRRHLDAMADRVAAAVGGLDAVDLLEIGCGSGGFMALVANRLGPRLRSGLGLDPAAGGAAPADPRLVIERRAFDGTGLGVRPTLVVLRHVLQHVAEPLPFLAAVRTVLAPGGRVLAEVPDLAWIARNAAAEDIFYEHCSLWSRASLAHAFAAAGLALGPVTQAFGGQYLLVEATEGATSGAAGRAAPVPLRDWAEREAGLLARWRAVLEAQAATAPVLVWGAGAKGGALCGLLDPSARLIAAAVDIDPVKQGRFVPGTGHPVLAPDDPLVARAGLVLVANANYAGEVRARLVGTGARVATLADA